MEQKSRTSLAGEGIFVQDESMGTKETNKQKRMIHPFTQKLTCEELAMCQACFFQCKALALIILLDEHGNQGLRVKTQRTLHNRWNSS